MVDIINSIIESISDVVGSFIGMLSWSPFRIVKTILASALFEHHEFLVFINWIIPFAEMVVVLETWGLAIGVWYTLSKVLRWLKAVE